MPPLPVASSSSSTASSTHKQQHNSHQQHQQGRRHRIPGLTSWSKRHNEKDSSASSTNKLASPAEEIKVVFLRQLQLRDYDIDGQRYHSVFTGEQIVDIILNYLHLPERTLACNVASRLIGCSLYKHVSGPQGGSAADGQVIDSSSEVYTLVPEAHSLMKKLQPRWNNNSDNASNRSQSSDHLSTHPQLLKSLFPGRALLRKSSSTNNNNNNNISTSNNNNTNNAGSSSNLSGIQNRDSTISIASTSHSRNALIESNPDKHLDAGAAVSIISNISQPIHSPHIAHSIHNDRSIYSRRNTSASDNSQLRGATTSHLNDSADTHPMPSPLDSTIAIQRKNKNSYRHDSESTRSLNPGNSSTGVVGIGDDCGELGPEPSPTVGPSISSSASGTSGTSALHLINIPTYSLDGLLNNWADIAEEKEGSDRSTNGTLSGQRQSIAASSNSPTQKCFDPDLPTPTSIPTAVLSARTNTARISSHGAYNSRQADGISDTNSDSTKSSYHSSKVDITNSDCDGVSLGSTRHLSKGSPIKDGYLNRHRLFPKKAANSVTSDLDVYYNSSSKSKPESLPSAPQTGNTTPNVMTSHSNSDDKADTSVHHTPPQIPISCESSVREFTATQGSPQFSDITIASNSTGIQNNPFERPPTSGSCNDVTDGSTRIRGSIPTTSRSASEYTYGSALKITVRNDSNNIYGYLPRQGYRERTKIVYRGTHSKQLIITPENSKMLRERSDNDMCDNDDIDSKESGPSSASNCDASVGSGDDNKNNTEAIHGNEDAPQVKEKSSSGNTDENSEPCVMPGPQALLSHPPHPPLHSYSHIGAKAGTILSIDESEPPSNRNSSFSVTDSNYFISVEDADIFTSYQYAKHCTYNDSLGGNTINSHVCGISPEILANFETESSRPSNHIIDQVGTGGVTHSPMSDNYASIPSTPSSTNMRNISTSLSSSPALQKSKLNSSSEFYSQQHSQQYLSKRSHSRHHSSHYHSGSFSSGLPRLMTRHRSSISDNNAEFSHTSAPILSSHGTKAASATLSHASIPSASNLSIDGDENNNSSNNNNNSILNKGSNSATVSRSTTSHISGLKINPRPSLDRNITTHSDDDNAAYTGSAGCISAGVSRGLHLWRDTISSEFLDSLTPEAVDRQESIFELICTEQDFLRDLELIDIVYTDPLLGKPEVMPGDCARRFIDTLFYNYKELIRISRELCGKLAARQSESAIVKNVGDIFLEWSEDLKEFVDYSVHVPLAQTELESELLCSRAMADFLSEAEKCPEARKLPVQSFIGRAATRFARYPLLLQAIIKRTPANSEDLEPLQLTVKRVKSALDEIDKRTGDNAEELRIKQISQRIELTGSARESLALDSPSRKLIKEGLFYQADGSQILAFLFDNSLIMATETKVTYAKGIIKYTADERIIPISMLDATVLPTHDSSSSLMGIRGALGLQPTGGLPGLLRNSTSSSSIKNRAGHNNNLKATISFVHIGCRTLSRTLFARSMGERDQWINTIRKQVCMSQTLVEAYTDFRVLSNKDFTQARKPMCSAHFISSKGCQMVLLGNKDGIHGGVYGAPASISRVCNAGTVSKIHVLRKYNMVIALSDGSLLVLSLSAIERCINAECSNGGGNRSLVQGTKVASSVGYFDIGIYQGIPLIVLMKSRGNKSYFKCIQPCMNTTNEVDSAANSTHTHEKDTSSSSANATPSTPATLTHDKYVARSASAASGGDCSLTDGASSGDIHRDSHDAHSLSQTPVEARTLRVIYQGTRASLRLIGSFCIPGKTKKVHFLRRKLCIVCTNNFEIVDIETQASVRTLPDSLDDDFSFVQHADSGQALAICKIGREFLLCYEEFGFFIDNFGRRSRPEVFIRWEMRPHTITFRYPYLIAINSKFLEVRHMETGVLLSVIRIARAACLNPDARSSMLHVSIHPTEASPPTPPAVPNSARPSTSQGSVSSHADSSTDGADGEPQSYINCIPGLAGPDGTRAFPEGDSSSFRIIEVRFPPLKTSRSTHSSS